MPRTPGSPRVKNSHEVSELEMTACNLELHSRRTKVWNSMLFPTEPPHEMQTSWTNSFRTPSTPVPCGYRAADSNHMGDNDTTYVEVASDLSQANHPGEFLHRQQDIFRRVIRLHAAGLFLLHAMMLCHWSQEASFHILRALLVDISWTQRCDQRSPHASGGCHVQVESWRIGTAASMVSSSQGRQTRYKIRNTDGLQWYPLGVRVSIHNEK